MWFDKQDQDDSFNYADPLSDVVCAFAWAVIVVLVAYLAWAYRAGMLPLRG